MDLKIVKLWKKKRERAERERALREIESRERERAERKRAQRQSCQLLEEREERKSQLWKDLENIRLYVYFSSRIFETACLALVDHLQT